jgi:hypothetical protein
VKVAWLVLVAACGDNRFDTLPYFGWDAQLTIGAFEIDQLPPDDPGMLAAIDRATDDEVVLFYGHDPPNGTSYETIEALLDRATANHGAIMTFADLAKGPARSGICLSFDDTEVDDWFALRPLLARHSAHVTFFVTRYFEFTDAQRGELHTLFEDGNSIEAHGVNHAYANEYIPQYGLDAYIANEIQPSIDILRDDGFTPVAYAHPGGAHTRELDDALEGRIRFARGISGAPK